MESLYILIPIAILLVCVAVGVFIWAVKSEQFEDLERQGMNILLDDDDKRPTDKVSTEHQEK
ncbi:cbb3-type cytochrome oxidase assembly protein CcoS [Enterovibrio sp. ZSDZ35]|uniref:Cbb3-type cytochrome oxidase assembly protein CcoS n=1 Tax=Enterovibrio qingdaonensis TaxID=2899818 RepID=A0ABT5QIB5_9GAMM|nr:cbb3-type cytochrome oxidase assembly protein CcoS [Enterovibrio sp. ZSDZ35]MDD1780727.1 cbb3-type cytochrome oxidase assembly protein CcoS [Enterovibrio sp. ZSDZ35]